MGIFTRKISLSLIVSSHVSRRTWPMLSTDSRLYKIRRRRLEFTKQSSILFSQVSSAPESPFIPILQQTRHTCDADCSFLILFRLSLDFPVRAENGTSSQVARLCTSSHPDLCRFEGSHIKGKFESPVFLRKLVRHLSERRPSANSKHFSSCSCKRGFTQHQHLIESDAQRQMLESSRGGHPMPARDA